MPESTCVIVRSGGTYAGAQGLDYFALLARTDPNEQDSVVLLDEHGRRSP